MRPSSGTLLLGIFAVMFGLLGAYAVRKELHKPVAKSEVKEEKSQVVTVPVAGQNLEAGRKLTLGDIALMKLTPAQMKAQKITGSFMSNPKQIIGRIVKTPIKEGATFDTPNFYPEGTGPDLSDRLKPGYRAVTITVDQDAAVAGFAIPGSLVDVLFRADAVTPPNSDPQDQLPEITLTLIEGAEVLALNKDTAQSLRVDAGTPALSGKKMAITLAVTQRQAVSLQVTEGRGSISLALRGRDERVASKGQTVERPAARGDTKMVSAGSKVISDTYPASGNGRVDERSGSGSASDREAASSESLPKTLDDLLSRSNTVHHRMEIYRGRQLKQVHFRNFERTTPPEAIIAEPVIAKPTPVNSPVPQTVEQSPIVPVPPRLTISAPRNASVPSQVNN